MIRSVYSLIMDTNNDPNNLSEGGGSAADHTENDIRQTDQKSNDEQITLPPEVSKIYQYTPSIQPLCFTKTYHKSTFI